MNFSALVIQDLADILDINHERADMYNKFAYECQDLRLKILLNQEVDQARDCMLAIKKLLREHFTVLSENRGKGQVYSMWATYRPSF